MTWETIITLGITIVSILSWPFIYIWRTTVQRVDNIEKKLETKLSKEELNEKLAPISEDVKEVKDRIDKILNYLIHDK